MKGKSSKPVLFVAAVMAAAALSGCLGITDFSLEPTTSSVALRETSTPSTSVYVRSNFDLVKNPYFSMLSESEMNAYSLIYEELSKGNQTIECPFKLNSDQLSKAMDSVLNDHPELFWIDNNYGYSYDPVDGSVKEIKVKFFDFADTPEKFQTAKAEFEATVSSIIAESANYDTLVERELFIHDYICENTEYDETAPYHQSAYSALVLHRSVCAGYARSFQYLMQRLGVTCYYVTGSTEKAVAGSGADGAHSWNIVAINGEYYNVDCLWDDTASDTYGSAIYPFFNVTDDEMVNHTRINMATALPSCNGTEYRYSNQFGPTIEADSIIFAEDE